MTKVERLRHARGRLEWCLLVTDDQAASIVSLEPQSVHVCLTVPCLTCLTAARLTWPTAPNMLRYKRPTCLTAPRLDCPRAPVPRALQKRGHVYRSSATQWEHEGKSKIQCVFSTWPHVSHCGEPHVCPIAECVQKEAPPCHIRKYLVWNITVDLTDLA